MGSELFLSPPTATLAVLLIAVGIALASMLVYRLMVDVRKLQSINEEISRYNERMREAQRRGNRGELRRLRREETRVRMLASYSTKQRLRVTLVSIIPFSAISILLGLFYGVRPIAKLPFDTPLGSDLSFYLWYTLCYFSFYLPLARIFGLTFGTAIPLRTSRGEGG